LPPNPIGGPYWVGQDVVRGIASIAGGGYVLDDWGGIHAFSTGAAMGHPHDGPYWVGQDVTRGIALLPDGTGGYVLDDWGGLHPFAIGANPLPPAPQGGPYWVGQDVARGVSILPDGSGGYVVDDWGGLHPFVIPGAGHTMPAHPSGGPYWVGQNVVRGVAIDAEANGGYIVDDWGGGAHLLHPPHHRLGALPPAVPIGSARTSPGASPWCPRRAAPSLRYSCPSGKQPLPIRSTRRLWVPARAGTPRHNRSMPRRVCPCEAFAWEERWHRRRSSAKRSA
jgi:hypothetical protein